MAPAITTPPPVIPLPNAPLSGTQPATPVDASASAPNWAHLMIRVSEFFVGGTIMLIGIGALLKRATGAQLPAPVRKYM